MKTSKVIQGREITDEDIQFVLHFIGENPSWHRKKLSIELAKIWNWRDSSGQLKDMACRTFMLKLHRQGHIVLPAPLRPPTQRKKTSVKISHSTNPVFCSLKEILPVHIELVSPGNHLSQLFRHLLSEYHYLDYRGPVGKNIQYLAFDNQKRPLACFLFGAAAWKTTPRDDFIGWDRGVKAKNLAYIVGNSRFLILPWINVPHLASYLLGQVSQRICRDWIQKYNHPVYLLETFVQKDRFKGTCYKAANWSYLGDTKGRTRNGQHTDTKAPIKKVYVYPLHKRFRDMLLQKEHVSRG
ncbi:MAG: DUF4338 domain-containing protein [Candidatus Marinimicrobia bacterium]|jgi:hypothetical protein|nr:DUF4338 domain-containing protein [Candidatus Neomarinimicrobiota bacterium]MBT6500979.1 DUF4338 domain-containing protein [Deltaproteobacteria bacterium]